MSHNIRWHLIVKFIPIGYPSEVGFVFTSTLLSKKCYFV